MFNASGFELVVLLLILAVTVLVIVGIVLLVVKVAGSSTPAGTALPPANIAGWYADPISPGQRRYWDGGRWTEHVADDR